MNTLHLNVKKKWFDMAAASIKKEEYRELKEYWVRRLCNKHDGCMGGDLMDIHKVISYTFKNFAIISFKNGYGKNAPTMLIECKGIDIGEAVPEWSDNWKGDVFRIKLGKILTTSNNNNT